MNKSIVVTGSSTGIGYQAALTLVKRGHTVFAGVRSDVDKSRLEGLGFSNLIPVILDVTEPESLNGFMKKVENVRIDGLVNNAGIVIAGPLEFIPIGEFRKQLDVNVVGLLDITQRLIPHLRVSHGRVVNISSLSGRLTRPFIGAYSASKFAVEALSNALRLELSPWGIQVSSILPGAVKTPIWEKSEKVVEKNLSLITSEERGLYQKYLDRLRSRIREGRRRALGVEDVVEVIERALFSKHPKVRYFVGPTARSYARFFQFVPDRVLDLMMKRIFFR